MHSLEPQPVLVKSDRYLQTTAPPRLHHSYTTASEHYCFHWHSKSTARDLQQRFGVAAEEKDADGHDGERGMASTDTGDGDGGDDGAEELDAEEDAAAGKETRSSKRYLDDCCCCYWATDERYKHFLAHVDVDRMLMS